MAYIVMACIVMAYMVMAYIFDSIDRRQAAIAALCGFIHAGSSFAGVAILHSVVRHFEAKRDELKMSSTMLWVYAVGALVVPFFGGVCFAHRNAITTRLGLYSDGVYSYGLQECHYDSFRPL